MSSASTTADDILACARTLILAGGYNGFSYADIADVVGIRKPSIHHHFPTKADLVRTLVSRYREEAKAGFEQLEWQFPDQANRLRAYTGFWKACLKDASLPFCVCALLASELPVLPAEVVLEVKTYFNSFSAWLTSLLERGQSEGRLTLASSARIEAEAFMATVHGAMMSARVYADPEIFGLVTDPLIERLTSGR
jgi:TetR/AcrR family transcriptional repressor of nem operon